MLAKAIQSIYLEYLPRYESEVEKFKPIQLKGLIKRAEKRAKRNYNKLPEPKTSSLNFYTMIWVRQEVVKDLATKTIQKISLDNPPPLFKAHADYLSLMPYDLHRKLRKKFYNTPQGKREEVWQDFNLPLEKIEKKFTEMTISRNNFASQKGYSSYIDMFLDKYKIPRTDFEKFMSNADRLIEYYNKQLPRIDNLPSWFYSEFNNPCWICRLPTTPFHNLEETLDQIVKKYKVLHHFKHKLEVKMGDNSKIFYKKETDSFEITINRNNNTRHQSMDLIHEVSHAVNYLRDFKKEVGLFKKGLYRREKEALKTELEILKSVFPLFYKAHFGEALRIFYRALFEIELYKNPKQDLGKLYAKTFNRCFKEGSQKKNPLYLLDEWITMNPFFSLPHTIAYAKTFLKYV